MFDMFNDLTAAQDGGLDCTLIHKGLLRYSDDVCVVVS